jgi:hypothetical protein
MTEIRLVNTSGNQLAINTKLGYKKPIKHILSRGAFVDVGDVATMDELNASPDIQNLLAGGNLRIDVIGENNDIVSEAGVPTGLGIGLSHKAHYDIGGGVGADDATLIASMPWPARILNVELITSTAVGASTVTLRDALAGAGNALSDALSSGAVARVSDAQVPLVTVAAGSLVTARMSDSAIVAEVVIEFERTA